MIRTRLFRLVDVAGVWCAVENPDYCEGCTDENSFRLGPPRHIIEPCDVSECGMEPVSSCQLVEDAGASYNGSWNTSRSGKPCMPWGEVYAPET